MSSSAESIAKMVNSEATGKLTEEELEESPEKNLSEAITRERTDRTIEVPPSKRRLDSFARLLASQSLCVAVTVFKGEILITANELRKTSQDSNAQITSMRKIALYFSELASTSNSSSSSSQLSPTEKIFVEVCSRKRLEILLKGSLHIQNEVIKQVATDVLNHEQNPINVYNYFYTKEKEAMVAGLAYGEFTKLYRDFKKLETTLINEQNDDRDEFEFEDTSDKIAELKKAFNKRPTILKKEENAGVHAEIQLLSHIIEKYTEASESEQKVFPKTIYIGISKLCCLHCRHMLEAANTILKGEKNPIKIEFRGQHDLDFSKWGPPSIFEDGFSSIEASSSSSSSDSSIAYRIGALAAQNIKQALEVQKPSGIMEASQSESDTDSIAEDDWRQLKNKLKEYRNFLQSMLISNNEATLLKTIRELQRAERILDLDEFQSLFREEIKINGPQGCLNFLSVIALKTNLDRNLVFKLLINPSLVGENVSHPFIENIEEIQAEIQKGEHQNNQNEDSQMTPLFNTQATHNNKRTRTQSPTLSPAASSSSSSSSPKPLGQADPKRGFPG